MTRRSLGRAALLVACAALLPTVVPTAAGATDDVKVVLTLRAPHGAADVTRYLDRKGLTVTDTDGWTVTARGSRAVARTLRHPGVSSVAGLGRQRAWAHRAVPGGQTSASLAAAYDVAEADGTGLTIATVQFAGWDPEDLDTYAVNAGLPVPTPVEVTVGDADPRDTSDALGSFEVALDQEVLLAAAPNAGQRVYFAPNSAVDAVLLYNAIADDAEAGLVDVVSTSWGMCEVFADEDPGTRAGIETALARIVTAGATVFAASGDLGAYDCGDEVAGPAVDFPASSRHVVGVGGTTLTRNGATWTETAWNDPASGLATGGGESSSVPRPDWQNVTVAGTTRRLVPDVSAMADPDSGFGAYSAGVGGWVLGGGTSAGAPLWAGHLATALSANGRTSGVGDIHDELYANPGAFRDVTTGSNLLHAAGPGYDRATGLGSPRWSVLADALFGDPVVVAPAVTRSLTVPLAVTPPAVAVTTWAVGEGTTVACDAAGSATPPESFTLAAGDRATRIAVAAQTAGGCLVGSAPVLLDTRKPVATGSLKAYRYDARTVLTWGASDPSPSSGVTYDVCLYRLGSGCVWTRTGTTAKTAMLSLSQGGSYVLRVTPRDAAGNLGSRLSTARYAVPIDQSTLSRAGSWVRTGSLSDWYGSHYGSTRAGSTMSKMVAGTRYELIYLAHPKGGVVDVYVSGVLVRRVNTYAATKTYRKTALIASYGTRKSRGVRLVVRSGHVAIDALRVAY